MKKVDFKKLFLCLIIVYSSAFIGSLFTSQNVNSEWYDSIKPSITPPNYVFPIVWNILFLLIALSLYFAWLNSKKIQKKKLAIIFSINLLLNIFWSILFFAMQNPFASFFELIILWLSIIAMIFTTSKINKTSSYLLIPYLLWVSFAGVLNYLMVF